MRALCFGLFAASLLSACGDDSETVPAGGGGNGQGGGAPAGGGGAGGAPVIVEPGAAFDRYCREDAWDAALAPALETELGGEYVGIIQDPLPEGTLDTMKIIPRHPFHVRSIQIAFGGEPGTVRVRLMTTFGRSYPGAWPDIDTPSANLIEPIELTVDAPDAAEWVDVDVSTLGVFLEPTQHYVIVVEHVGPQPQVAIEALSPGDPSRAIIHVPGQDEAFGLDGNFRMRLAGDHFCSWSEPERWFGEHTDAPFAEEQSGYVQVADLDGDGHDDVVVYAPGPQAYRGDGNGSFSAFSFDPFEAVPSASLLVFADVDNDGDRDAFAGTYVTVNGDGDAFTVGEGDCNDLDAAVRPNATETLANGRDDDCDGIADDGTDTADADGDGVSIAGGDCDDTLDTVAPGLDEALDGLDNDCSGAVDETFVNRILLNDGTGHFSAVTVAGVETIDPSTTAAFSDTDADGFVDLYWGNWLEHYPDFAAVQGRFVVGNGDGTFTDVTEAAGMVQAPVRPTYGVGFVDLDDDGDQDLYVGNYQLSDNYLFQNQGDGTFIDVAESIGFAHDDIESPYDQYPGGHSYGAAFGDPDNDGDIDAFLTNLSHPRTQPWADTSQFLFNDGTSASFDERREALGILYDEGDVNAVFADWDNDADLDLYVSSLYPTHYARLYRNDGDTFVDVTYEANTIVHLAVGVAFADVDGDGDLDLLASEGIGPRFVHHFENRVGQDLGWLQLDLRGTTSNRDAVGARVYVTSGGTTQLRDVEAGSGHHLQHSHLVHFGLADASTVDDVVVRWPSGLEETISGIEPRGRYVVVEGAGTAELVR